MKIKEVENTILNGDSLSELKKLPNESINSVMCSPPYYGLRDYQVEGQLGLELTFQEYINKLCDIFDQVKRVLRDDGTCWVNLGDSYSTRHESGTTDNKKGWKSDAIVGKLQRDHGRAFGGNVPDKSLIMIPFRFVIEMVNRGWILRNTIIWHKPNCMPSSIKDRFTVDFEYLFFFVKNKKYFFETQYEPLSDVSINDIKRTKNLACLTEEHESKHFNNKDSVFDSQKTNRLRTEFVNLEKGRIKRTVWQICPKPFKEAHFAVYPEELCWIPIKSGCPEFICNKCGMPKIPFYEKKTKSREVKWHNEKYGEDDESGKRLGRLQPQKSVYNESKFIDYKPTCKCNVGFSGGIILDPFFGAGTTGLVALKQNKKFIGIELNKKYIEIATKRLKPFLEQTKLNDLDNQNTFQNEIKFTIKK